MNYPAFMLLLKTLLPALAMPFSLLYAFADSERWKYVRYVLNVLLVCLTLFSTLFYFDFGYFRYGRYINPHDVFHYYIGSKYSREIDYADLYRSALLADMEGKKVFKGPNVRNLSTHGFEPVSRAMQEAVKVKPRFSPERWQEFKHDIAFFISIMPANKWNQVLTDKGYNATPVWNGVARFLTNRASTDNWIALNALLLIDPVLMILALSALWWAFGWRAALLAALFFDTNFMGSFVHIKGALLRLDWVMFLVIATCLLKKGYYKSAGVLVSYAAMARVFPAVFMFGIGAKVMFRAIEYLRDVLRTRKLQPLREQDVKYLLFLLAFAIASVFFVSFATIDDGGVHRWQSFSQKIGVHNSDISTTRVGFKYIFLSPFQSFGDKVKGFEEHHLLWRVLMGIFLLIALFPARKLEDYETVPYGFVPAFFLAAPTFYYYVMLIVPFLLFAAKVSRWQYAAGVAGMFAYSSVASWANRTIPFGFQLCLLMSWMLLALVVYIMAVALFSRAPAMAASEPQPDPTPEPEKKNAEDLPRGKRVRRKQKFAAERAQAPSPPSSPETSASKSSLRLFAPWFGGVLAVLVLAGAGFALHHGCSKQPTAPVASSNDATLVFVGDVMLSRNVAESIKKRNMDYTFPFQKTMQYTAAADLAFCNLECPVSDRGDVIKKRYVFRAEPAALSGVKSAGFDVVSLANNHVLDFGPDGLEDTIRALGEYGIADIGITTNDAPQTPRIFDVKGIRIGCLGYADPNTEYAYAKEYYQYATRPAKGDKETIRADIEKLKPNVDIVVVCIHWGTEYQTEPDAPQKELGHYIIDSGASIVAGHHPHVLQDPERYKNGVIIYSLGNFVFDQHSRPATRLSRLFRFQVNKAGIVKSEYLPLEITNNDWQPTPTVSSFVPFTDAVQ